MTSAKDQISGKLNILIVFGYGNMFNPKAGNESRLKYIVKGLECNNDVTTLERVEFKGDSVNLGVKSRYFFNDFNFKNTHFGVFFSDLNPSYYLNMYSIIKKEQPDVIQVSYPRGLVAAKICISMHGKKNIFLVYEAHDLQVEVGLINSKDRYYPFIKRNITYLYDRIIEKVAVNIADHILTVSEADKKKFIETYSLSPLKITPVPSPINIPALDSIDSKEKCRQYLGIERDKLVILFHGTFNYLPNKEAVDHIKKFILPEVCKFCPDALFVIAGKGTPNHRENNLLFVGFVEDLYCLLRAADIALVPILKGGGTRIKILDYMCIGLPIVSTKKGIEGIEAKNCEHALIVEKVDEEFISALKTLIENESERERIGLNARKLAEEKYDFHKVGEKLTELYRQKTNEMG